MKKTGRLIIVAVLLLGVVAGAVSADSPAQKKTRAKKKMTATSTASSPAKAADSVQTAPPVPKQKEPDPPRAPAPKPYEYRKVTNTAFATGERLVFDVSYGFITAGEAVMSIPGFETIAGRKAYHVEFTVNSLSSFNWVYKVEDKYRTYIDAEAMAPLKFEQHIREGGYQRDFIAEFDQEHHLANTTEGSYQIPEYVHDILSAFYYVRTMDLTNAKVGDQFLLYNFYKDKSHELAVRVLGRQELEVEAGTFRTIVVEPMVKEGGLFKSEGRIVIWLTDDDLKIPVRVNTKVVIGSIDTELREYSGLLGPLRARIK